MNSELRSLQGTLGVRYIEDEVTLMVLWDWDDPATSDWLMRRSYIYYLDDAWERHDATLPGNWMFVPNEI